jgi:hypothetical protein
VLACALFRNGTATEVSADGKRALPPIANLSEWATGPAALSSGSRNNDANDDDDDDGDGDDDSVAGAAASETGAAATRPDRPDPQAKGQVSVSADVEAAMAMVKELGYLPGTLGDHIARMRNETEGAIDAEASVYVFGTELLEAHHAELLDGMRVPQVRRTTGRLVLADAHTLSQLRTREQMTQRRRLMLQLFSSPSPSA